MIWLKYLLEVNLYLGLFYALYYLLLRRETHYQLNRFYLLATSLLAFALPLLQLGFLKPAPILIETISAPVMPVLITSGVLPEIKNPIPAKIPAEPTNYYLVVYVAIALIMLVLLGIRIYQLNKLARKGKLTVANDVNLVELDDDEHAFSFFSYLFISKKLSGSETIIRHELVHIQQKHSLDIMYLELVKIICWFNPFVYLTQNSIKELHEFIADDKIATLNHDVNYYTDFLIKNAYGLPEMAITNNFFTKNLLKKRIMMLHQKRSGSLARLKYLTTLPLMAGMLCLSTLGFTKDYPVYDLLPKLSAKPSTNLFKAKLPHLNKKSNTAQANINGPVSSLDADKATINVPVNAIKFETSGITKEGFKSITNKIDSIFGASSPLYVVDGVILTAKNAAGLGYDIKNNESLISVIPQENITSMEILKDKSAETLYGAKGKNGVILVTTKNGVAKTPFHPGSHPLAYVDGKPLEWKDSDLGFDDNGNAKSWLTLAPPQSEIAVMEVFKPEDAIKTFGPAGADGVIFFTTLQGQAKKGEQVEVNKKDSSDAQRFEGLYSYVEKNVRYPTAARDKNIQGRVFVMFNVNEDNSVTNIKLMRGLTNDINDEVIRVIKNWKAPVGISKDRNFTIPVSFSLEYQDTGENTPNGEVPKEDPRAESYKPNNFKSYVLKETVIRGYVKRSKE